MWALPLSVSEFRQSGVGLAKNSGELLKAVAPEHQERLARLHTSLGTSPHAIMLHKASTQVGLGYGKIKAKIDIPSILTL